MKKKIFFLDHYGFSSINNPTMTTIDDVGQAETKNQNDYYMNITGGGQIQ